MSFGEIDISNFGYNQVNMNKYNLIETFFKSKEDCLIFLMFKKQRIIANKEATCFAELIKENDYLLYTLTWLKDGRFISENAVTFKPTDENVKIFNDGCKILSERLSMYLDTDDSSLVPSTPPAFGTLTHYF